MIWAVWTFSALPLFVLDGWLVAVLWPLPALTLALCLYCALFARLAALPGLLVVAALARSVLLGGDAAAHLLALGIPVALLVPARNVFSRRHLPWQAVVAVFLAVALPQLGSLLARVAGGGAIGWAPGWDQALLAALVVPPCTWLLRLLPPLRWFEEAVE